MCASLVTHKSTSVRVCDACCLLLLVCKDNTYTRRHTHAHTKPYSGRHDKRLRRTPGPLRQTLARWQLVRRCLQDHNDSRCFWLGVPFFPSPSFLVRDRSKTAPHTVLAACASALTHTHVRVVQTTITDMAAQWGSHLVTLCLSLPSCLLRKKRICMHTYS